MHIVQLIITLPAVKMIVDVMKMIVVVILTLVQKHAALIVVMMNAV